MGSDGEDVSGYGAYIRCGQATGGSYREGARSGYDYGHQSLLQADHSEQRIPLDFSLGLPAETEEALEESRRLAMRGKTKGYATGKDLVDGVLAAAGVDR